MLIIVKTMLTKIKLESKVRILGKSASLFLTLAALNIALESFSSNFNYINQLDLLLSSFFSHLHDSLASHWGITVGQDRGKLTDKTVFLAML